MDPNEIIRIVSLVLNTVQTIALSYIGAKYYQVLGKPGDKDK